MVVVNFGCGEFWHGIEVNGLDGPLNPNISDVLAGTYPSTNPIIAALQQGVLLIDNGSIIENATTAVKVMSKDENFDYINQSGGGVVIAKNSTFKNNKRSVEFMRYTADFSASVFDNCQFYVDDDFRYEGIHNGDAGLLYQFTMWDVHGVDILGCKFRDERNGIDVSQWEGAKSIGGISSINADYNLRSYCINEATDGSTCNWKRAVFTNMYRAVRSTQTHETMGNRRMRYKQC